MECRLVAGLMVVGDPYVNARNTVAVVEESVFSVVLGAWAKVFS